MDGESGLVFESPGDSLPGELDLRREIKNARVTSVSILECHVRTSSERTKPPPFLCLIDD